MIRYFAQHPTVANLTMLAFIIAGVMTLPNLRRETFPRFSSSELEIRLAYPGASALEVESSICQRVEDAVDGVTDVAELRCEAHESIAIIVAKMNDGADFAAFSRDIEQAVNGIDNLPEEVETPVYQERSATDPVLAVLVSGPMTPSALKTHCEAVKDRLQAAGVKLVDVGGFSDRQLRVEFSPEAVHAHGLSAQKVAGLIERQSLNLPAGSITGSERDWLLRVDAERTDVRALLDLVLMAQPGGGDLRLGDVATVTETFEHEGGVVLADIENRPNYLLMLGHYYKDKILQRVDELNQQHGARIAKTQMDVFFRDMLFPSRPEAIAMLKGGKRGVARFSELVEYYIGGRVDLRGMDMRGLELQGVSFRTASCVLSGVDFRGANVARSVIPPSQAVCFDDADLSGAEISHLSDSSLKGANLSGATLYMKGCNLDGANLANAQLHYPEDCSFRNANLQGATWHAWSRQATHDFTGGSFCDSRVFMIGFSGSSFGAADLENAQFLNRVDLSDTDFQDANCRGVQFGYVDFSRARVAGADFTGATLRMTDLSDVDVVSARGLAEAVLLPAGSFGPRAQQLEALANESRLLSLTGQADTRARRIEFELHFDQRGARAPVYGEWRLFENGQDEPTQIQIFPGQSASFYPRYLMDIAGYWPDATVDWKSIRVSSSKAPLKGRALKQLVIGALGEAWGQQP
jgi:uncharacterized protein YjbI with pentapeptide repeats